MRVHRAVSMRHISRPATYERILPELLPALPGQTVDAAPEVGRLDGDQDTHVRRYLHHAHCSRKSRESAARSGVLPPFTWILIFVPEASSNSTRHSDGELGGDVRTSTNAGEAAFPEHDVSAASTRFLSSWYATPSALDVRLTPCWAPRRVARLQSCFGMDRVVRFLRH